MKKIALFIISVITILSPIMFSSCVEVGNGIQTEFIHGVKFGDSKEIVKGKIGTVSINEEKEKFITYRYDSGLEFAGVEWEYVTIYFNNNKMCKIIFENRNFFNGSFTSKLNKVAQTLCTKYDMRVRDGSYYFEKGNKSIKLWDWYSGHNIFGSALLLSYEDKKLSGKSEKEAKTYNEI